MTEAERKAAEAQQAMEAMEEEFREGLAKKPHQQVTAMMNRALASGMVQALDFAWNQTRSAFNDDGDMMPGAYDALEEARKCALQGVALAEQILSTFRTEVHVLEVKPDMDPEIVEFYQSLAGRFQGIPFGLAHDSVGRWLVHPAGYPGRIMGTGVNSKSANMVLVRWDCLDDNAGREVTWELPDNYWDSFDEKPTVL